MDNIFRPRWSKETRRLINKPPSPIVRPRLTYVSIDYSRDVGIAFHRIQQSVERQTSEAMKSRMHRMDSIEGDIAFHRIYYHLLQCSKNNQQ